MGLLILSLGVFIGILCLISMCADGFTLPGLGMDAFFIASFLAVIRIALAIVGACCTHHLVNHFWPDAGLHSLWLILTITLLVCWRVQSIEANKEKIDETAEEIMRSLLKHKLIAPHLSGVSESILDSAVRDLKRGDYGGYILQPPHTMCNSVKEIATSMMWCILRHKSIEPHLRDIPKKDMEQAIADEKAQYAV